MPLGVILKSEQKLEDMVEIMADLQHYAPLCTTDHSYEIPGLDNPVCVKLDNFHHVLLGE